MHRQPVGDRAVLAWTARAERILGDGRPVGGRGHERGMARDGVGIKRRAFFDVGLHEELAASSDEARDLIEE